MDSGYRDVLLRELLVEAKKRRIKIVEVDMPELDGFKRYGIKTKKIDKENWHKEFMRKAEEFINKY